MKRIFCVWALLMFFALPGMAIPGDDTTSTGTQADRSYILKTSIL